MSNRTGTHHGPPTLSQKIPMQIRMFKDEYGEWQVSINNGEPVQATEIEAALWVQILSLRKQLRRLLNEKSAGK